MDSKAPADNNDVFQNELQEIPYYMRERVAALIEEKVESRVQKQMAVFKEEVHRELEDQRMQNQMHIAHYLDHPYNPEHPFPHQRHNYDHHPYPYYGHHGYHHAPHSYGGYPPYAKHSASKSPVRGQRLYEVKKVVRNAGDLDSNKHSSIRPLVSPKRYKKKAVGP